MEIRGFQDLMRELYFHKDSHRGKEATLLWLVEEVGELSEALRKGDQEGLKEEMADVVAWVSSLANLCEIDLEEALEEKYPGRCRYCESIPCRCTK